MSAIVGLTESISSTQGRERLRRRAAPVALTLADGAVDGFDTVARSATGLRPRSDYAIAGVLLLLFGAAITARATDLYLTDDVGARAGRSRSPAASRCSRSGCSPVPPLVWPRVPTVVRRISLRDGHPALTRSSDQCRTAHGSRS